MTRRTTRGATRGAARKDTHRPALDGIRAIAVIAVLLYHGLVGWTPGGFLGVDVFFVLSGYLITTLLVREHDRWGGIDIVTFYQRRARRLLPALVLVVTFVAVWAGTSASKDRLGAIRADGVSALLYVANWRLLLARTSYFDQYGDPSPFLHTWSLAIEEQYYLLFPLLLVGLLHVAKRRHAVVAAVIAGLAVLSAGEMALLYTPGADNSRIYFGTDTRVFELLIGSLLALLFTSERVRSRLTPVAPFAGIAAVAGIVASFHVFTESSGSLYLGGFAGVCVVSAVLVASVELAPWGPVGRLLSLPPVVWVGAISYGLYLWHWPLFVMLSPDRTGLTGPGLLAVRVGVSFAVATVSYYVVERPIRSGALARVPRRVGVAVAALGLPAALLALLVGTAGAVPPPADAQSPFGPVATNAGRTGLLVVGDSVGLTLASSFPGSSYPGYQLEASVKVGCGLAVQYLAFDGTEGDSNPSCTPQLNTWSQAVMKVRPQAVLLSLGAWEVFDHVLDDKIVDATSPEYAAYLDTRLGQALTVLSRTGAHVFIPDVACYGEPSTDLQGVDIAPLRNDPARIAAVNKVIRSFARSHRGDVTVINTRSYLCPGGKYAKDIDGIQMRNDGVHYTKDGGALLWRKVLMPVISKVTPAGSAGDGGGTRALLVGDSVPLGLSNHFPAADHPGLTVNDTTLLGCSSFPVPSVVGGDTLTTPSGCADWGGAIPSVVDKTDPSVGVLFVGIGEQFDKLVDGKVLAWGTPEHDAWLTAQLKARIELFRSRKIPVLLATNPCHRVINPGTNDVASIVNDDQRTRHNNDVVAQVAASYRPKLPVADLYGYLCPDGYTNEADGITLRDDGLHFTADGAAYVWKFLAPLVTKAAAGRS